MRAHPERNPSNGKPRSFIETLPGGATVISVMEKLRRQLCGTCQESEKKQSSPDAGVYLPWSVRLQLRVSEVHAGKRITAELRREDLLTLLREKEQAPNWVDASAYLTIRAFDADPLLQEELLRELCNHYRGQAPVQDVLMLLESYLLRGMAPEATVTGTKLRQISGIGPQYWRSQCEARAKTMKSQHAAPCLIAYSSLMALEPFLRVADTGDHLMIVIKDRLARGQEHAAYVITCGEKECTLKQWKQEDRHRLPTIHLFDDTVHTGATTEETRRLFAEQSMIYPSVAPGYFCVDQAPNT